MQSILKIPWKILPAWFIGNRLRILMYHSISENPRDPHAISPTEFKRHMRLLQTARVVSLVEALELLKAGRSLMKTWVITFDDGLLDFYTNALPILKEFGYPVTLFLPTSKVGGCAAWDSYDPSKPLMSWQQLEMCQPWNVTFGSHTASHAWLTECSDQAALDELMSSFEILQNRLADVIPALAYPGGYQDARIRQLVREARYACALGASSRWGNGAETDLFQLRRERTNR